MSLRFSDGMEFDTSGPYRVTERSDGLYVLGRGLLCPVNSRTEAADLIARLTAEDGPRRG